MRKENASFVTKFISEAGSYLTNADYFAFVELKDYACYVIADGIDTDDMKKSAEQAVTAVIARFSDAPGMSSNKIRNYLNEAHRTLLEESAEIRLEASILVLVTDYKRIRWGYAGNCRLTLIHNGAIAVATKDTSLTQRLADNEEIPLDMISSHEERNNLYAYLGQPGKLSPVISTKHKLEDGDIILLQTRGAWENIGDAELLDATEGVSKAEEVCTGLEDVILSQRMEVIENYTIATIFINKIYQNPKQGKYKKLIRILITIAIAITIMLLGIMITRFIIKKKNLEKIDEIKEAGIEKLEEEKYESARDKFKEYESIKVKVKASSKDYPRVQTAKLYFDMSENICDAITNINTQNYNYAVSDFDRSLELVDELKELGEDTTELHNTVTGFRNFAELMREGSVKESEEEYREAVDDYNDAADEVRKFDDRSFSDIATEAAKSAADKNDQKTMSENYSNGERTEAEGDGFMEDGDYTSAKKSYQDALDYYSLAAASGDDAAKLKVESVNKKIDESETKDKETSDEKKRSKAIKLITKAHEAKRDRDYETAKKKFEQAKNIYEELNDADKVAEIEKELNEISGSNNESEAVELVLKAFSYMGDGNFKLAKKYLKEAMYIYSDNANYEKVNQISDILDKLDVLEKSIGVG